VYQQDQAQASQQQAASGGGGATPPPAADTGDGDGDVVEGEIVDEGGE